MWPLARSLPKRRAVIGRVMSRSRRTVSEFWRRRRIPESSWSIVIRRSTYRVGSVSLGFEPRGVVISPDGKLAYVALSTASTIAVVDIEQLTVLDRITVGRWPRYVALSPDGTRLAVGCSGDRGVSVVDTVARKQLYLEAVLIRSPESQYPTIAGSAFRTARISARATVSSTGTSPDSGRGATSAARTCQERMGERSQRHETTPREGRTSLADGPPAAILPSVLDRADLRGPAPGHAGPASRRAWNRSPRHGRLRPTPRHLVERRRIARRRTSSRACARGSTSNNTRSASWRRRSLRCATGDRRSVRRTANCASSCRRHNARAPPVTDRSCAHATVSTSPLRRGCPKASSAGEPKSPGATCAPHGSRAALEELGFSRRN